MPMTIKIKIKTVDHSSNTHGELIYRISDKTSEGGVIKCITHGAISNL